jgi:hypothetical protein
VQGSYLKVSSQQSYWLQQVSLDEAVVYIGNRPGDAVQLPDAEVSGEQWRLQVRPLGEGRSGYLLYNLSDEVVNYQPYLNPHNHPAQPLAYGRSVSLHDQDRVVFGEFQLVYFVGTQELTDLQVEIKLDKNGNRLSLNHPLSGEVLVKAQTDQPIQPIVDVILGDHTETTIGAHVSNPQDGIAVPFQLVHPRAATPPSGDCKVVFHVRTHRDDPNKFAVRTLMIQLDPYPHHEIALHPHGISTLRPNWFRRLIHGLQGWFTQYLGLFRVHNGRSG